MNNKDNKKLIIRNSTAEFLIFTSQAGEDGIEVRVEDENVWLTQKLIAKLFGGIKGVRYLFYQPKL